MEKIGLKQLYEVHIHRLTTILLRIWLKGKVAGDFWPPVFFMN